MDKKVLIMCTGNSCRSIIAEALINEKLEEVIAYSCGVNPSGKINKNAKKVLEENGIWRDEYYSKHLDELIDIDFDLVVTVCDNAKETCPIFPKKVEKIHIGFEDPDGKEYEAFEETFRLINDVLLEKVEQKLKGMSMKKSVFTTDKGVKISFTGTVEKKNIIQMVENCQIGSCECMSDETKQKVKNMEVSGKDGDVTLNLSGEITKEEIEEALSRSKVINETKCC